ncbi:SusC/RagA family TonB-linked outer membrane protein [Marinigracilibium pacificum]|uniref:SusC/RagA family TonB-linked outer membrane protein n=1 Tax=Marinigracilibium pacificum TaxID=2729599 RepID=A0A848IXU9_9BACT|nr:SusC/RagA family TonB-linked outer membrane protein [Marinigracilibium pacificum]NMM49343.1 SusC/RagA family TonB-linked outer membrane protein [Marinigracilibium pacificum]
MRKSLLFLCALLLLMFQTLAQESTVTGTVTGANGEGIPGVNVLIQGTGRGVVTDISGNYSIGIPSSDVTLVFSSIGYVSQEIPVGARSTINVVLQEDVQQLSEVVVTAVGIEQSQRELGYSVQEVKGDNLTKSKEPNLVNALNSKAAGVNVYSSSGDPGSSSSIRIRGNTSIFGNNSPLFVVDGVPIDNSQFGTAADNGPGVDGTNTSNRAVDINPEDIESISVLKGPAATVLYGIRAANGAIIITTKKGVKNTKPSITFSTSFEVTEVNKLPDLQREFSQGRNGVFRGPETFEGFSWGERIDENPDLNGYNSFETFFIRGLNSDNNISVRGGTENVRYYASAGYLRQEGISPNSEFERYSFKSNISADLTEKFTASISANYVNSGGVRMQQGSNLRGIMLGLVRNAPSFDIGNGKTGQDAADDPATYTNPDGTQRSYRNGIYDNPFWVVNKNYTTDEVNRIIGFVSFDYEIIDNLKATYKLGIDQYSDRRLGRVDIVPDWNPGQIRNDNIYSRDLNSDFYITYNKDFDGDFSINALLGHNYYKSNVRINTVIGNTLSQPGFYNIANASDVVSFENINQRELVGVFANVKLGFRNFLFLNLSARNDWSSTLPEGDNSFFYPAVSLGFDFTQAFNMQSSFLSYGKIRASYGQVGNDAPLYATQNYFTQAVGGGDGFIADAVIQFPFLGNNAFEQNGVLANNNLRAELTSTFEVGADLKFFDNRLGLDVTYYYSETKDQIIPVDISSSSGYLNRIQNAGLISNEGIELVLNGVAYESDNFSWDISLNFTAYETTVEELAEGIDNIFLNGFTSTSSRAIEGEPFGVLFGQGFQRTDDGQLIIGTDGFPLQAADPKIIGDPNPDWLMGISNSFQFGDFNFSFLWDFRYGGDVWNGTNGVAEYFGVTQETADYRGEAGQNVVFEGVVQSGTDDAGNPIYVTNTQQVDLNNNAIGIGSNKWQRYGFGTLGEENVQDASWIRLRQVSLSYSFPRSVMESGPFDGLDITLTGRNLLLFTPYTGIDPETNLTQTSNGFGLDYFNNPNTRGYSIALRFTF